MSDHVFLNLVDQLGKSDKMLAEHFIIFFPTSLINSIIQEHKC